MDMDAQVDKIVLNFKFFILIFVSRLNQGFLAFNISHKPNLDNIYNFALTKKVIHPKLIVQAFGRGDLCHRCGSNKLIRHICNVLFYRSIGSPLNRMSIFLADFLVM